MKNQRVYFWSRFLLNKTNTGRFTWHNSPQTFRNRKCNAPEKDDIHETVPRMDWPTWSIQDRMQQSEFRRPSLEFGKSKSAGTKGVKSQSRSLQRSASSLPQYVVILGSANILMYMLKQHLGNSYFTGTQLNLSCVQRDQIMIDHSPLLPLLQRLP